jgi:hypothetical protein
MFNIRNGLEPRDALSILICKFAVKGVQVKLNCLKLYGTHQLMAYADDDIIEKNTDALVIASKDFGFELDADKTNYVAKSLYQSTERSQHFKG